MLFIFFILTFYKTLAWRERFVGHASCCASVAQRSRSLCSGLLDGKEEVKEKLQSCAYVRLVLSLWTHEIQESV